MNLKLFVLVGVLAAGVSAASAADAKANWEEHCAKCHGAAGKADTKMGQRLKLKDYSDAKVQAALTDEALFNATMKGVTVDGKEKMKGYADKLSEQEGKDLVALIRSFKS
jgi:mono/diheme cytochrome c family protein